MFEIGSSLREARMRRGLELSDVERDTRIRTRYLTALEEERFDVLPGPAYAKGFLLIYGKFLEVDVSPYLDAFETSGHAALWSPDLTSIPADLPVR